MMLRTLDSCKYKYIRNIGRCIGEILAMILVWLVDLFV